MVGVWEIGGFEDDYLESGQGLGLDLCFRGWAKVLCKGIMELRFGS